MEQEVILAFAGLAFTTGGAAWAGVKLSLNGMRLTVNRIEKKLDAVESQVQENRSEISGIRSRCVAFHPDGQ